MPIRDVKLDVFSLGAAFSPLFKDMYNIFLKIYNVTPVPLKEKYVNKLHFLFYCVLIFQKIPEHATPASSPWLQLCLNHPL